MSWGPDQNGINGVHLGKEVRGLGRLPAPSSPAPALFHIVHLAGMKSSNGPGTAPITPLALPGSCTHAHTQVVTAAGSCIALALAQIAPQILTWRQYAQAAYCAAQHKCIEFYAQGAASCKKVQ